MPTHAASLLAECAAHPDDDTPRMIWADAIGGERGELVALQCGRDDLPRAELTWRNRRERELLAAHAMTWSGLERIATRVRYRRGFVDAIELPADAFITHGRAIVEAAPLLTALTLTGVHPTYTTREGMAEAVARLERVVEAPAFAQIRALDLVDRVVELDYSWADAAARVLARSGALAQLTALGVPYGLTATGATALGDGGPKRLERLWLRDAQMRTETIRQLAAHVPRLVELDFVANHVDFAALAGMLPNLRSLVLRLLHSGTLVALAGSELAHSLDRLVLEAGFRETQLDPHALRQLAAFDRLRELELRGFTGVRASWLGGLPELRSLGFACWSPDDVDSLVEHFAPRLDLLDLRGTNRLAGPPPGELDVLVDEPGEISLLDPHPRPRACWYATPWIEHPGAPTKPAWLVCEDGTEPGRVWDLGAHGTARIRLGRGVTGEVVLRSGTVARTHAVVSWHDGAHWIRDMRSTNGTPVAGEQIEHDAPLRDGVRLTLGSVLLRYFTRGELATACARRVRTHEPLSGLPRLARTDAAWLRIANLAELERDHGQIAGDRAIAEVARRLIAAAGDAELSAPQRNAFRVYPRELASHLAAACAGSFDHEGLMLDLRIEARPIG